MGTKRNADPAHSLKLRLVVMTTPVRSWILLRPHAGQLVDRYSERKAAGVPVDPATDLSAIAVGRVTSPVQQV